MIFYAPAKLNIGLHVIGRREDGYHNIETIFQPFNLYDIIEITDSADEETSLKITGINLPITSDNLCLKAFDLLNNKFNLPPVHIHLHKQIPFGAGLGGGSSDASAILKGLNTKFKLGLSIDELIVYAAKLGSDCPFFLYDNAMYAEGIGVELSPVNLDLSDKLIFMIKPNLFISTVEAYQGVRIHKPVADLRDIIRLPIQEWKYNLYNDFEESLFIKYPIIRDIKLALYEKGALYASMTGSGSAVYGIFDTSIDLQDLSHLGTIYRPVEL
ncbi:4-(cytidine 5'-diphospho)-2-C-methyl-D-erythritol kinase [Sphingobacterium sp. UT-1RO-CII-1]|uniref:4-(cytidine 5'-diphospho)-2-C-methyl-D-erythritol kinase n=1 Tax=Sphingobacterium sp. UT-1RO-CII-1 TaxID=2995225 RepID=UPI00227A27D8|nr:4-(cytidine 5'-diphospho)-2-C-methyl-D-erythritol kinase [Sphingobacterium sp. UT-1RO-CII-1]MCY4778967.1 4-(cytidine 5'-diphospho)-2-C-methyl-D-erythritol kinase [Sphingobacterium sp. UT-1RO-CII-1]